VLERALGLFVSFEHPVPVVGMKEADPQLRVRREFPRPISKERLDLRADVQDDPIGSGCCDVGDRRDPIDERMEVDIQDLDRARLPMGGTPLHDA
jgi:hypothetical protein